MVDAVFQSRTEQHHARTVHADIAAGTFWVLDAVFWNAMDLASCTAEFRCFWLASKATEERDAWEGGEGRGALAAVAYHHADAGVWQSLVHDGV